MSTEITKDAINKLVDSLSNKIGNTHLYDALKKVEEYYEEVPTQELLPMSKELCVVHSDNLDGG